MICYRHKIENKDKKFKLLFDREKNLVGKALELYYKPTMPCPLQFAC